MMPSRARRAIHSWAITRLIAQSHLAVAQNGSYAQNRIFVRLEDGLDGESNAPFDASWLDQASGDAPAVDADVPSHLPIPDFLPVFNYVPPPSKQEPSWEEVGAAAREVVDSFLPSSGAVLFRNLNSRIASAEDFGEFWSACTANLNSASDAESDPTGGCSSEASASDATLETVGQSPQCQESGEVHVDHKVQGGWKAMNFTTLFKKRGQISGIDLSTSKPSQHLVEVHNELSYQPRPMSKIAFYCLQDALSGGETLLVRNSVLTEILPKAMLDYVKDHGGVLYKFLFFDRDQRPTQYAHLSWQEKFGVESRQDAVASLVDMGFEENDVQFDGQGNLIAHFVHPGFVRDNNTSKDVWFNRLNGALREGSMIYRAILGDGTDFPTDMLKTLRTDLWKASSAVKLRPGDWIVLDNFAVQHGRLTYEDDPLQKRTLLVVYTE